MSKGSKFLLILGSIILILLIFVSVYYNIKNRMIKYQEEINNAWAQVESQLQRRYDLIPNLVNTVKGYAKHEKEIFEEIAEARAKMFSAKSFNEKVKSANLIENSLSRLMVIVENYPLLKADANFRALMDELAGTENRIAVERKRYNDKVAEYNKYIRVFPNSIIAGINNFKPAEYYKVPSTVKEAPRVEFE
jgi:LemA protein